MTDRFAVFDVETPNFMNNRISAIGVTLVDRGEITREFGTLVNPETHFDAFNIRLTGITPQAVANKPTFLQLWQLLEPLFENRILVAHNAPFDMRVLAKCLHDYGVQWHPSALYACTCSMGRICYPEFYNHKLDTMCRELHISLDHHKASSDSRACAELLVNYLQCGLNVAPFIRSFCFESCKSSVPKVCI